MKQTTENKQGLLAELLRLWANIRRMDFATVFILISVGVLSTVNYYYGGRSFIKKVFTDVFASKSALVYWSTILRNIARFVISFLIPIILIKWPLRAKFKDYGLGIGDWRFGLKITLIFVAVMMPIIWFVSSSESFARTYPSCFGVKDDWGRFALFAATYLLYMTGWEFLWRGYMLFGLKEKFGFYAILVQMIPFTILHFGKPFAESISAVFAGVALGILAWRSRSFWYCMLTHTIVIISINFVAVLRYRAQNYGIALPDLLQVLKVIFER